MGISSRGSAAGPELRRHVLEFGPTGLSDRDLLALVLGGGGRQCPWLVADRLLAHSGDLAGLAGLHPAVMVRTPGMGTGRAARLLSALELGARSLCAGTRHRLRVRRPEDLHPLLRSRFRGLDRERFLALYLDTRHRVLAVETVSVGTLNVSVVHPREVFKLAVALSAAAVIVAHNHPSGCAEPSAEDLELTARLDRCGQLLGISLLDHLVAGAGEIVSIREIGWPVDPAT
ncbi:hypothetical protein CO151_05975 [bacterium CG_4_9_14_3_um_filter_65_15]|nr:MAG: hypothetical protein CO151_05975 [bacterium CG_4_9_14_3_um_filter_65_15]